jgi:hypothetical protein
MLFMNCFSLGIIVKVVIMIEFERCDIAFDDSGRGKLKDGQQVLSEVDYFLYFDKVLEIDQVKGKSYDDILSVYGQFSTVDSLPEINKGDHYTLCLKSRLELEIKVKFVYQPADESVSCEFTVVGDSLRKFYNLLS